MGRRSLLLYVCCWNLKKGFNKSLATSSAWNSLWVSGFSAEVFLVYRQDSNLDISYLWELTWRDGTAGLCGMLASQRLKMSDVCCNEVHTSETEGGRGRGGDKKNKIWFGLFKGIERKIHHSNAFRWRSPLYFYLSAFIVKKDTMKAVRQHTIFKGRKPVFPCHCDCVFPFFQSQFICAFLVQMGLESTTVHIQGSFSMRRAFAYHQHTIKPYLVVHAWNLSTLWGKAGISEVQSRHCLQNEFDTNLDDMWPCFKNKQTDRQAIK